jgi:hypothetical protein
MIVLPGELTRSNPALVAFQDKLYLAWTGLSGQLHLASSSDGQHFAKNPSLPYRSRFGPALAVLESSSSDTNRWVKLFLAWADADNSNTLSFSSSVDALAFQAPTSSPFRTSSPALSTTYMPGGDVIVAWRGEDEDDEGNLYFNSVFSLGPGSERGRLQGQSTSANPALLGLGFDRFLLWTGNDSSHHLNISPDLEPTFTLTFESLSTAGPAVAAFDAVYLAWVDPTKRIRLATWATKDAITDFRELALPGPQQHSDVSPALGVAFGHVYLAWKGFGGSGEGKLNVMQVV